MARTRERRVTCTLAECSRSDEVGPCDQNSQFRVWAVGVKVKVLGLGVSGFRVQGFRLRV